MKAHKWGEFNNGGEFLEATTAVPEDSRETDKSSTAKSRLTELRRRIEERMDSKRIALEYDYLMLDDLPDGDRRDDFLDDLQKTPDIDSLQ